MFEIRCMDAEAERSLNGSQHADETTRVGILNQEDVFDEEDQLSYFEKLSCDEDNKKLKHVNVQNASTPAKKNKSERAERVKEVVKDNIESDELDEERSFNSRKLSRKELSRKNTPVYVYTYKVTYSPFCFFVCPIFI